MKFLNLSAAILSGLLAVSCAAGKYEKSDRGVTVNVSSNKDNSVRKVRLQVLGDKIIRVSATPDKKFVADNSLVTVPQKEKAEYTITETDSTVSVVTSEVTATVFLSTGDIKFYDKAGKLIVSEAPGGRHFDPIKVEGTKGYTVRQIFESLDDDEGIYGLGQHQSDEFNYKGLNEELFQYQSISTFCRFHRQLWNPLGQLLTLSFRKPGAI